ncbi:hypothetical protein BRADI_5g04713v3 [Brachypodium distachyon]|uniref:Uncharacterized protein n=1 Tax=Brachypodium distachyon TaxID=15368 RepID=A0A2K2CFI0_BRADI|nr:hypothetical protein BRADI_5g04713v3 [Brachypodium distachyon]
MGQPHAPVVPNLRPQRPKPPTPETIRLSRNGRNLQKDARTGRLPSHPKSPSNVHLRPLRSAGVTAGSAFLRPQFSRKTPPLRSTVTAAWSRTRNAEAAEVSV